MEDTTLTTGMSMPAAEVGREPMSPNASVVTIPPFDNYRGPLGLQRRCLLHIRLYVPSLEEATHPRCDCEGYPDWPGRASSKEGES
jgi:hypothetical protein